MPLVSVKAPAVSALLNAAISGLKLLYPDCRVLVPVRGSAKKALALRFGGENV